MTTIEYLITTGVPTVVTLIVGVILRSQIKAQREMMETYKNYLQVLDISKIKDLHEYQYKLKIKMIRKEIDMQLNQFSLDMKDEYDELSIFADTVVNSLPAEKQEEFISEHFPLCKKYFEKVTDGKNNVVE
jgi:hypothetical protein